MLDFSEVKLELLTLHKVGNKEKVEESFFAKETYEPSVERNDITSFLIF